MSFRMMECREGGEGEGKRERRMRRRRDASLLARIMCGRMCIVPGRVVLYVVGLLHGKGKR